MMIHPRKPLARGWVIMVCCCLAHFQVVYSSLLQVQLACLQAGFREKGGAELVLGDNATWGLLKTSYAL